MVNAATRILLSKTGRRTLYTILLAISAWLVISLVLARMETQRDFSSRLRRMQTFYRGLLNYRDVHDGFPTIVVGTSEGSSLYSWRLALWPFIEKPPVYIRQESAWNSAANMAVREFNARLFSWHLADSGNARLITVSVCGDGTVWGNAITTLPERVPLAMEWPCNLEHWSQPGDFVVRGPLENSPLHESLGIECRKYEQQYQSP